MTRNGIAFRRQPLVPLTDETGFGLLPTPEASNTKAVALRSAGRSPRNFLKGIPTPRANDAEKRGNFDTANPRNGLPAFAKMWPTPHANCGTGAGQSPNKAGGLNLQTAVQRWPTPTATMFKGSSPAALTRKNGADRSNDRLDHAVMASDGGQLNPTWVEWLMGFPLGWTDLGRLATRSSRKSRKSSDEQS
nr:hypothetical protein [Bradyrhizobium sp. SZCCHNRI1073]